MTSHSLLPPSLNTLAKSAPKECCPPCPAGDLVPEAPGTLLPAPEKLPFFTCLRLPRRAFKNHVLREQTSQVPGLSSATLVRASSSSEKQRKWENLVEEKKAA